MLYFIQNPLQERVLTFCNGFNHPKIGLELFFAVTLPVVCLHDETQQTTSDQDDREKEVANSTE